MLSNLLDDFGRTNVEIEPIFTFGQQFDRPLLGETLSVYFTENRFVIRLLVQAQRQSERCHFGRSAGGGKTKNFLSFSRHASVLILAELNQAHKIVMSHHPQRPLDNRNNK